MENFDFIILEGCSSIDELNECEIKWIKKLKSNDPLVGYNEDKGGKNYINRTVKIKSKEGKECKFSEISTWKNGVLAILGAKAIEFSNSNDIDFYTVNACCCFLFRLLRCIVVVFRYTHTHRTRLYA